MWTQKTAGFACCSLMLGLAAFACPGRGAALEDPGSVLIIVNDAMPPEPGTGSQGASEYVGRYYAQARGIPLGNILHISSPIDPGSPILRVSWDDFTSQIRDPLKALLEKQGLVRKVKYIVSTYGVPSYIFSHNGFENLSVDSALASIYAPTADEIGSPNPVFQADPKSMPIHWNPEDLAWPMYAVTRLDGPSPVLAVSLVERALQAEGSITLSSGVGYFDFRRPTDAEGGQAIADRSVADAATLCRDAGLSCELNDQSVTGRMISSAPNTLWAWGRSGPSLRDAYSFAQGAVGAQLASALPGTVGSVGPGSWAWHWIAQGITATWGATSDQKMSLYAAGNNLLNHLWNGYSFGEAAYISTPALNGTMVFLGDPLYTPVLVQNAAALATPPGQLFHRSPEVAAERTTNSATGHALDHSLGVKAAATLGSDALSLSSGTGSAGGTVILNLNLTSSAGSQPGAIGWTFGYSSDITSVTVVSGSSSSGAQKSVACNGKACVIYGLNTNAIPDGTVAVATFHIAANPSTTTIPIQVTAAVLSSAGGAAIPATTGGGTVTVSSVGSKPNPGDPLGLGKLGIVWTSDISRQAVWWYMSGAGGNTENSFGWISQFGVPGWHIGAIADFNGDGYSDLFWVNDVTRQAVVWYMGGAGGNVEQSWEWISQGGVPGWSLVGTADFNHDGIPDLLWQNDISRQVVIWYMSGSGTSGAHTFAWLSQNGVPGWSIAAVGDFNHDGTPDVVWQNDSTRQSVVWYLSQNGTNELSWEWISQAGVPGWSIAGTADFNGDGTLDLLLVNGSNRQAIFWYLSGPTNLVQHSWDWVSQTGVPGWWPLVAH
jgi:uncharacterized protein (TIGR03790 family)